MNKFKNLFMAGALVAGMSVNGQEVSQESADSSKNFLVEQYAELAAKQTVDALNYQEKYKELQAKYNTIVADLESKAIADARYDQKYVIAPRPTDVFEVAVATSRNIFFADPHKLNLVTETQLTAQDIQYFVDHGFTVEKNGKYGNILTFAGDMTASRAIVEAWTQAKQYTKTLADGQTTVTLPAVEYITNAELDGCPTWTDPKASFANPTGTSSLWLSTEYRGDNTVPVAGLDKAQSFVYLTNGNDVNINIIDTGYDTTNTEINTVYSYNTAQNQPTHIAADHGTATINLAAGQINGQNSIGTNPWAKVRGIDAGPDSGILDTDINEGFSLINDQIETTPNNGQVLNASFTAANSTDRQLNLSDYISATGGKGVIVVAHGNTGGYYNNPIVANPNTISVGATNTLDETRPRRSGSSYGGDLTDPNHLFAMADGNFTGVPNTSYVYSQKNGTSYAAPIVSGQVSLYQKFYPNHTFDQIKESFANTAFDLQTPGYDAQTGYGYIQGSKAIVYGAGMSLPSTIDMAGASTYNFQFTPETLNDASLQAAVLKYPNGQPVTTYATDGNGKRTYTITVSAANGFSNGGTNQMTYSVTAPAPYAGCVLEGKLKKIDVSGMGSLGTAETASTEVSVYPNPVVDQVTITNIDKLELTGASIFDLSGRLVSTVALQPSQNGNATIDMSNLSSGAYLIQLQSKSATRQKPIKVIKK